MANSLFFEMLGDNMDPITIVREVSKILDDYQGNNHKAEEILIEILDCEDEIARFESFYSLYGHLDFFCKSSLRRLNCFILADTEFVLSPN